MVPSAHSSLDAIQRENDQLRSALEQAASLISALQAQVRALRGKAAA